jgi:hypothetical protein
MSINNSFRSIILLIITCVSATVAADWPGFSVAGKYRHDAGHDENAWHTGYIQQSGYRGGDWRWTNAADKTWKLEPDVQNNLFRKGPDKPYYKRAERKIVCLRSWLKTNGYWATNTMVPFTER